MERGPATRSNFNQLWVVLRPGRRTLVATGTDYGWQRNVNHKSCMKSTNANPVRWPALMAALLGLFLAGRVAAQTFTLLHTFTGGSDGGFPSAGLILSSNILYGTAALGGSSNNGTVFAVNTDGSGFTNLYNFTASPSPFTNSDGAEPRSGLILSGQTLYGTTSHGGSSGNGTVFAVNTDGTGFTNLHSLTYHEGSDLNDLILSSNTLYGTTFNGGSSGYGTVFAISTNGTGFTNLYGFTATSGPAPSTNSDGANPSAGLILAGNTLYGTATDGGSSGEGTVFAVNTDGTGFTNLHSFTAPQSETNSDGAQPSSDLILAGNTLYGTALAGGSAGVGTVFAVNTNGTGFAILHSFTNGSDGSWPSAGLILSGHTLYGTAEGPPAGGDYSSDEGTVFALNTDGTGFTTLYSFTAASYNSTFDYYTNSNGANPVGLILSGYTLYGTAGDGGSAGRGTLFSLSFPPQLTITLAGTNVILTWPATVTGFDYSGFVLQSTANLASPAVWTSVVPSPILVNGLFTVTNSISSTQQFYRLNLLAIPAGLALVPAGAFTMGNSSGDGDITDASPTNVTVSAFYMEVNLVTSNQWRLVYSYATNHGYGFSYVGAGKAPNHPVQSVDWYDAVKWCNARSQQAGLVPVYYTDAGFTQVYTNGDSGTTVYVNWGAKGYRLPTEAEWEKAARGGLSGLRFPFGDTISESLANYFACNIGCGFTYDLSSYGYNTNFDTGALPYTSPAGYFAPNGYGLCDMAGNVQEWCWDWYAAQPFPAGSPYLGGTDPRGPASGSVRVLRGGYWNYYATFLRCAYRGNTGEPNTANDIIGFRCVRRLR